MTMLSDDLHNVAQRLRLAAELDVAMTPENCRLLAGVLQHCLDDVRCIEARILFAAEALPSNVVRFPQHFRCVDGPDGGAA